MEEYSAIKMTKSVFYNKWMQLETIMPSKISQPHQKDKYHVSLICDKYIEYTKY